MVDSVDRERLGEAKDELFGVLESDQMRNVPFIVLANKQDMPRKLPRAVHISCSRFSSVMFSLVERRYILCVFGEIFVYN